MKKIQVHNPNNLPTIHYEEFEDLQGDLKVTNEKKIRKLKQSIVKHGIFVPMFVWRGEDGSHFYIMDGHQRKKAFMSIETNGVVNEETGEIIQYKIPEIPYWEIEAKNKKDAARKLLQINSKYAEFNLETEFFEAVDLDISVVEEVEIPEFEEVWLLQQEEDFEEEYSDEDNKLPDEEDIPKICKKGDIWLLGEHVLLCGDATKEENIKKVLNSGITKNSGKYTVITDPPYGMNAVTRSGVLSEHYGKEDIEGDDNQDVAITTFGFLSDKPGVWFGANYYPSVFPSSGAWLVWDKNNGKSDQADCELAWTSFDGVVRKFTLASEKVNRIHPTQKPVELFRWIIQKYELTDDILDPFSGSGAVLIACERSGLRSFNIENSVKWCNAIIKRWYEATDVEPVRNDGVRYGEVQKA